MKWKMKNRKKQWAFWMESFPLSRIIRLNMRTWEKNTHNTTLFILLITKCCLMFFSLPKTKENKEKLLNGNE